MNPIRPIAFSALTALSLAMACSVASLEDERGDRWEEEALEEVDSLSSAFVKGAPGSANGQYNFCDGATACVAGEGDCDRHDQCSTGVCGRDNGPKFGMIPGSDVCVPAHCVNKRLDGNETQLDCGGDCGATCGAPVCVSLPVGHADKCTGGPCACAIGEGDCDANADCAVGLRCGADNGPKFGFTVGTDACVPAHCINKKLDGDEASADCGGSCGALGPCAPAGPVDGCGDGNIDGVTVTSVVFAWLTTGCSFAEQITFRVNGQVVIQTTADGAICDCVPGIQSVTLSDPGFLALLHGGSNDVEVLLPPFDTAFGWAKATVHFADNTSSVTVLGDTPPGGSALADQVDLCIGGFDFNFPNIMTTITLPGEECDDGNTASGDGCEADCTLP